MKSIKIPVGGIWEEKTWELRLHTPKGTYDNRCPHLVEDVFPAIIVAKNEGGYNSTGVCLLCVLDVIDVDSGLLYLLEEEASNDLQ